MDIGQFICEKDLMKNFKAASAPTKKAHLWISMFSLLPWVHLRGGGGARPCSYCQAYHMWVSQDINIPRQPKALERAVFRWSPLVWAAPAPGQFGRKAVCLQSPWGPAGSKVPHLNGIRPLTWISPHEAARTRSWRSLLLSSLQNGFVSSFFYLVFGS